MKKLSKVQLLSKSGFREIPSWEQKLLLGGSSNGVCAYEEDGITKCAASADKVERASGGGWWCCNCERAKKQCG